MMVPCCLRTEVVSDLGQCDKGDSKSLVGGAISYKEGECPASAEEAADWARGKQAPELLSKEPASLPQEPAAEVEELTAEQVSQSLGCCYSIGYGSMMRPCCLRTESMTTLGSCPVGHRIGGAMGFCVGSCPTSAEQAGKMLQKGLIAVALAEGPSSVAVAAPLLSAAKGPEVEGSSGWSNLLLLPLAGVLVWGSFKVSGYRGGGARSQNLLAEHPGLESQE